MYHLYMYVMVWPTVQEVKGSIHRESEREKERVGEEREGDGGK